MSGGEKRSIGQYILKRILLMIPTLFGITLVVFILIQSLPGGPLDQILQGGGGGSSLGGGLEAGLPGVSHGELQALKSRFHFDRPLLVRYGLWLRGLMELDWGRSFVYEKPVVEVVVSKLPVSLQLGGGALLFTYILAIPLGVFRALRRGSFGDHLIGIFILLFQSLPHFIFGLLLLLFFGGGSFWSFFPMGGFQSDQFLTFTLWEKILDRFHHGFLPLICYTLPNFIMMITLVRGSLLEESRRDYVRTAQAKGLSFSKVFYCHVLPNAWIPWVTGLGGLFMTLVSGSVLIETVFNLDGFGLLTYTSILRRDYEVVMASVVIHALVVLVGQLISDVLLVLVDPRSL